jgi:hypothetical protein
MYIHNTIQSSNSSGIFFPTTFINGVTNQDLERARVALHTMHVVQVVYDAQHGVMAYFNLLVTDLETHVVEAENALMAFCSSLYKISSSNPL